MEISKGFNQSIPEEYLAKWQHTLDLMAQLFEVPSGLIMRVLPSEIEVFLSSNSKDNPYKPRERAKLNTGLYCETVMKTRKELQIPNALEDPHWKNNPDICLGMISYMGVPLICPDGEIFGTICVLDRKTRHFSKTFLNLLWQFKDIIEADFKLIQNNFDLTDEIEKRKKYQDDLQKITEQLEMRLEELNSFSYTVSHDLRSPLNHIVIYADIMIMNNKESLSENMISSLEKIKEECFKASDMIAAILNLSHISQAELTLSEVNLSVLAEGIMEALRESQPDRDVEVVIQSGIIVRGNNDLLLDMLENLLENAWKYTSKTPHAKIEFYSIQDPETGNPAYCVKDNGVGFDMKQAGKLFQPFNRLHKTEDFKGTGIGLATVKRIVKLHNGHIKGDSIPGQGALFTFTIGL